jgi:hypothetical protein
LSSSCRDEQDGHHQASYKRQQLLASRSCKVLASCVRAVSA